MRMNALLVGKQIDFVAFDDVSLFMFQHDNLYNHAIPRDRKHQDVRKFCLQRTKAFCRSPVRPDNRAAVNDARYCVHLVVAHLLGMPHPLTVLDIGAHVGDFSLKMGNLIRTFNRQDRVHAFDPTAAGALLPANIAVNGLNEIVFHEDVAVDTEAGFMLFTVSEGRSDEAYGFRRQCQNPAQRSWSAVASYLLTVPNKMDYVRKFVKSLLPRREHNLVVQSVSISDWIATNVREGVLFVKIDVEGIDMVILDAILETNRGPFPPVAIFEFSPASYANNDQACSFLEKLLATHDLFDIFYSPTPAFCRSITAESLSGFVSEIGSERIFGYTDILMIPKCMPGSSELARRLESLRPASRVYVM